MTREVFPQILTAGDCGLMVLFGNSLETRINNAAHAFSQAIEAQQWPEVREITPAIRGALVQYDPLMISATRMHRRIQEQLDSRNWLATEPVSGRRLWELPVHYGGQSGPDIHGVAKAMGCDVESVIEEHCALTLRVLMLGFAPGCAYLGPLPERWDLPRLNHVKPQVPAGSISIAVRQAVLFATVIPTGWRTIGRTPFLTFSRHRPPYFFLSPGDEVRFTPIDANRFAELAASAAAGEMIVTPHPVS